MAQSLRTLKEVVAANSKVEGKCRLWSKNLVRGRPIAIFTGEDGVQQRVDLHVYLGRKKFDLQPNQRVSFRTTCGNPNCINSAHLELKTVDRKLSGAYKSAKCSDMELNQKVFSLLVSESQMTISRVLGITRGVTLRIMKNTAMLPFFQLKLQAYLKDVTIEALRNSGMTSREMRVKYGLSHYAADFILSEQNYPTYDEPLYIDLLSNCIVLGDHLEWAGKVVNGGAVSNYLSGGAWQSAVSLMYYCATKVKPTNIPKSNCGCENCMNPYHLE